MNSVDPSALLGNSLATLDALTFALTQADSQTGLYEAATLLANALRFTRCAILALPEENTSTIIVIAASDDPTLVKLPLDLVRYPGVGHALRSRKATYVEDVVHSELLGEWAELAAQHGGASLLAVPMVAHDNVVGALLWRHVRRRGPLHPAELAFASTAARVVAASLRGSRLLDTLCDQTVRRSAMTNQEQRRQHAIDQYRAFVEGAADGVAVVDGAGVVLYVNRAAEQLTGYARGGLQGQPLQRFVAAEHREGLNDVISHAAAGVHLAGFDLALTTTSGETLRVLVSTSAALAEHGAVVLTFRDVTIARSLEGELRKTKDFLERLIDSTVDGIVAADIRGRVMLFNRGAERLYGYTADEVIGQIPVWKLYSQGGARAIMTELRSTAHGGVGRLLPSRRQILTKVGELVPVSLSASTIYQQGQEVATVGIISDLRDRIQIEQRLAEAQEQLVVSEKQAILAELAGTTAHELNQPLTSVMGYSELLKKRIAPDDANARAIDIILKEAERMAEIVRKIGRITRYETKAYVGSTTILDLDKSTTER